MIFNKKNLMQVYDSKILIKYFIPISKAFINISTEKPSSQHKSNRPRKKNKYLRGKLSALLTVNINFDIINYHYDVLY